MSHCQATAEDERPRAHELPYAPTFPLDGLVCPESIYARATKKPSYATSYVIDHS